MRTIRAAARSLLLAPLSAALLHAQEPAPAPVAGGAGAEASAPPLSLDAIDASRLVEGRWRYVSTVARRGATVELGRRSLSVARVTDGGADAIVLVDETTGQGGTIRDSVFVSPRALRALRQHAVAGPVTMRLDFWPDGITGTVAVPGAPPAEVRLPAGPAPIVGSGMLESLLALVPLAEGWRASVPQLMITPVGAAAVPVTLEVVGREFASVPAGTYDCWVVDVGASGASAQRLWVDVASRRVVLLRNAAPRGSDVLYETALVGEG